MIMWNELGLSGGTAIIILIALYFVIKWAVKNGIKEAYSAITVIFPRLHLRKIKIINQKPGLRLKSQNRVFITWIFFLRSQPSLLHSVWCLHGHDCRKDIRSYDRSWSGSWNHIQDTHPFPAPDVHSHHSKPGKD